MMISGVIVMNDGVKLKAFDAFGAIDQAVAIPMLDPGLKNYQRLDLGLCVFCAPETCEVKFERYQ